MTKIDGTTNGRPTTRTESGADAPASGDDGASDFSNFLSAAADGALAAVATVAPVFPGGELVRRAAGGLLELRQGAPSALSEAGGGGQLDKMWEMQRENQAYNMQYMQLQQEAQADNRRFSSMTNLMKVRHDTAKSAINNMRA